MKVIAAALQVHHLQSRAALLSATSSMNWTLLPCRTLQEVWQCLHEHSLHVLWG